MDGCLLVGGGRRRLLLRKLDDAAGDTLKLPHVLATLADYSADLGRGYEDLHRQPHVFGARHETLFTHLLEDQVLSLIIVGKR